MIQLNYRFEKVGNCPNCGFPIIMKNRAVKSSLDPEPPTKDDIILLCPCMRVIHGLAEKGYLTNGARAELPKEE